MKFDVKTFDVHQFDTILARGLSKGLGERDGQMCIEAAICATLGLPHGDDPKCVANSVRTFKIKLNDARWSSAAARATGLHDLGLAQLGSLGTVNDQEFTKRLAIKTVQVLIPTLFNEVLYRNEKCMAAVHTCERVENLDDAANAAHDAVYAAHDAAEAAAYDAEAAVYAAHDAAEAAAYDAACAAEAAAYDAEAAACAAEAAAYDAAYDAPLDAVYAPDKYLVISAGLALDVLRELGSPGIALLNR